MELKTWFECLIKGLSRQTAGRRLLDWIDLDTGRSRERHRAAGRSLVTRQPDGPVFAGVRGSLNQWLAARATDPCLVVTGIPGPLEATDERP